MCGVVPSSEVSRKFEAGIPRCTCHCGSIWKARLKKGGVTIVTYSRDVSIYNLDVLNWSSIRLCTLATSLLTLATCFAELRYLRTSSDRDVAASNHDDDGPAA